MNTQMVNETYYLLTVMHKLEGLRQSFESHDEADKLATNLRKVFNPDFICVEEILVVSVDFDDNHEFIRNNEEVTKTEEY